jgi:hypothetical protein
MRTKRAVTVFAYVILLASCGAKNDDERVIHFALNEAKNTVTGMPTSQIKITTSAKECQKSRTDSLKDFEEQEYFEIINSICITELPYRLNDPFLGKPRYLDLVIKNTINGISTTEIFYEVNETWPDKEACEKIGGFYSRLDPQAACYSHQTSDNIFVKNFGYADMVPTKELVTIENEQRMLLEEPRQ